MREREAERVRECVREREREKETKSVCVRESERETEDDRANNFRNLLCH